MSENKHQDGPSELEEIEAEELDEQALEGVAGGMEREDGSDPVIINELQCYC